VAIPPHLLITASNPLLSSPSIFAPYRRPRQLPVTAMARRPHGAIAHHADFDFCVQVSHLTAEGCLRLSSVVGERCVAGVDTYPYFSTQISSSRLRPRRLIRHMRAWTNLACDNFLSACKSLVSMVETLSRERDHVVEGGRKENGCT
ncbi:hypothetical protein BGY98DRAFT_967688, partial [Russula aff. rugulosa BPL654]